MNTKLKFMRVEVKITEKKSLHSGDDIIKIFEQLIPGMVWKHSM